MYRYLRRAVEGVGVEHRLDHDERLRQVLPVEVVSVIRALVRTVVEHLQERRTPQVEHELKHTNTRQLCVPVRVTGVSAQSVTGVGSPGDTGRRSRRTGRSSGRLCGNRQTSDTEHKHRYQLLPVRINRGSVPGRDGGGAGRAQVVRQTADQTGRRTHLQSERHD